MVTLARLRHPNKEVEAAVEYAVSRGLCRRMQGLLGRVYCAHADRHGCQMGVNGTTRSAGAHARQIIRAVERCPHHEERTGDADL